MSDKDRLFDDPARDVSEFAFDERVVHVFPDMIKRSVPGYGLVVPMLAMMARRYARDDSRLYDLGCSRGGVALAMSQAVRAQNTEIIAIDNSPAMIESLRQIVSQQAEPGVVPIRPVCQDILDTPIDKASVVVLNFTLQFIEPRARSGLLSRIAKGMLPGGALFLSEKLRFEDAETQELQTAWHHDFKRAQGYSELEIAAKRDALENVLRPETFAVHRQRLYESGFSRVYPWFQAFSFVSLVAFR